MQTANLSPELLRSFVTIVEQNGFIRAAQHLHKTQSTISQHIKRLEQEVGTELFSAQGRKRILTPAGEILFNYAKRLLRLQEEALFATSQTLLEDVVHIGVSHSLSANVLPEFLAQFKRAYPNIRLKVRADFSKVLIQQYDQGEYDLVITIERSPQSGEIIGKEKIVWLGAEHYQWTKDHPLPLAFYDRPCQLRESALQLLNQSALSWQLVYNTNNLASVLAAVKSGLAITACAQSSQIEGTEIITNRCHLPEVPDFSVVLRNRSVREACQLLGDAMNQRLLRHTIR